MGKNKYKEWQESLTRGSTTHIHQLKGYFQTKCVFLYNFLLSFIDFIKVGISNKP
ncbi:hypothetical protein BC03BB108_C0188 (plasmid) [Bacillus cereus 03BB108]|nr:hypothetical protein BC03BB108_C0188 [Bacillus cereus 03BB108]